MGGGTRGAGAGEILLTSMDRDGTKSGYDLELTAAVSSAVRIPVIASGGAGKLQDLADALAAGAHGVLAASIFHFRGSSLAEARAYLRSKGYPFVHDPRRTVIAFLLHAAAPCTRVSRPGPNSGATRRSVRAGTASPTRRRRRARRGGVGAAHRPGRVIIESGDSVPEPLLRIWRHAQERGQRGDHGRHHPRLSHRVMLEGGRVTA
jgi:hypothetical protein